MDLKAYERTIFANQLRLLLIKDICECCEGKESLELHHDKQFAEMLKETLDRLGYKYSQDTKDYTQNELNNITDMLMGIHLRYTYTTLCEECHTKIHSTGDLINHFLKRNKKVIEISLEEKNKVEKFLENMFLNKIILYREIDRRDLIKTINLIDKHNSSIKKNKIKYIKNINALNDYLKNILKLRYIIEEFSHSKTIDGKRVRYKASWRIVKI